MDWVDRHSELERQKVYIQRCNYQLLGCLWLRKSDDSGWNCDNFESRSAVCPVNHVTAILKTTRQTIRN
jgi:hypothetical protein